MVNMGSRLARAIAHLVGATKLRRPASFLFACCALEALPFACARRPQDISWVAIIDAVSNSSDPPKEISREPFLMVSIYSGDAFDPVQVAPRAGVSPGAGPIYFRKGPGLSVLRLACF